jgi:hypothetical protein
MRYLLLIAALLLAVCAEAQNIKLPDINKVDSVRVIKRYAAPGDSVRKIQFVTIEQGDTTRGALQDSAALVQAIRDKISQENSQASNNTYLLYQQFTKAKGVLEYGKMYERVARQKYTDWTWSTQKTPYLGKWQMSGQGITAHVLTVSEDAKAIRDTGTPKYSGTFRILAQTRVELVNYLANNAVITFDFVARNQVSQGGQTFTQEVFMSTDGKYFLLK